MQIEITLAPAMWAPFYSTQDLTIAQEWGKEVLKRDGHWFRRAGGGRISVGDTGLYGSHRPWEESSHAEENELQQDWKNKGDSLASKDSTASRDYYVVMSLAPEQPIKSVDVDCGHFYPDRLFVHGRYIDEKKSLPRYQLMKHLEAIGLRSGADYWDPVQILAGYKDAFPRFDLGLRAETEFGPRWFDVREKILLPGKLPDGYQTDFYPEAISARIYFDQEIDLNAVLATPGPPVSQSTMDARITCYRTLKAEGRSHDESVKAAKNLLHTH